MAPNPTKPEHYMVVPDESGFTFLYADDKTKFFVCADNETLLSSKTPEPTTETLPILYLQILMMMVATGFLQLLLRPLYQQRLTAALVAGILLGPTLLSQYDNFMNHVVPFSSVPVLTMFKNLGIMFYMFLVGLEMNLTPIVRVDGRTLRVAIAGIVVPLAVGFGSYFVLIPNDKKDGGIGNKLLDGPSGSALTWAIVLTSTNLPNLTKTLSDLKLLRTDIGRTAVSSALYNDIVTWLLLLVLITVSHEKMQVAPVAGSAVAFLLFSVFIARPVLSWIVSRVTVNGLHNDKHIHFVVFGVMLFCLLADTLGLTSPVGAFVFGFILPSGQLTARAADQLGAITNWISVPLYCLDSGIKTNIHDLVKDMIMGQAKRGPMMNPYAFVGFVVMCWMAKVVGCMVATYEYKMEPRQALCLAVLMNSKGLLPIFIINFAKDQLYFLGIPASTSMVTVIVLMMISVPIFVKLVYKPPTKQLPHSSRTLSTVTSEWPLRIIFGIHSIADVQPIMELVQISYPTVRSPISIMVLHLMELTERTSAAAMLIMHNIYGARKSAQASAMAELQNAMEGMEEYGKIKKEYVSVECLTTLSPYRTMHEDISSVVDDKYATVVVLPFDLKNEVEEDEVVNCSGIRNMTHNLLESAPCTVGLFVNRGFGSYASPHPNSSLPRALILFFIGGSDDREALTYAWRTTSNPQCTLTVVRFLEGNHLSDLASLTVGDHGNRWMFDAEEHKRQKIEDDDFVSDFRESVKDNTRVRYIEEVSNNGEETITIIRDIMAREVYELCIVGRGNGSVSPLISGLLDLVEYPELGVIADAIATSHFSDRSSVMVIQQYVENSSDRHEETFTKKLWDFYKP